jgi:hypothetical protein
MTTTDVTPTEVKPPIPLDERPIGEMPFAGGDETRALLARCSVSKAIEIEWLGCTGAAGRGLSIEEITALRIGLGGGGVGLPCFVPPQRFCLAHNTIGGLQREQESRSPENVAAISRELTPKEAGQVAFTETVRRSGKGGVGEQMATAAAALGGHGDMPRGVEMLEEGANGETIVLPPGISTPTPSYLPPFTCPEHTKTNWSCRFCVAQAIVEGELDTTFAIRAVSAIENSVVTTGVSGSALDEAIEKMDAAETREVEVYVLAATYKRKLSR